MLRFDRRWFGVIFAVLIAALPWQDPVNAQSSIFSGGGRPFVIGFTPVIGPGGGVGGVDVDAEGVLSRVATPSSGRLDEARSKALQGVSEDLQRRSPMRKVSLRRLQAEITKHAANQEPLSSELLYLAGLQRIHYVFAYPETKDIVVAGPAEGWVLRGQDVVGTSSGDAVLRLDDLLDALHAASTDDNGEGVTCSIDPTEEGMRRLQQMFKSRDLQLSEAGIRAMEQQVGDQLVTVTGVRPTSHFARVMVSADYMMKRIAMDLDRSPVANLPSYMQLLHRGSGIAQLSAPRWWLAPDYETVEKSADALAWRFQGRGIQTLSEHGYLNARGDLVNAGRPSALGKLWADKFTDAYDELGKQLPVFSQLRGCIDLAVLATLLTNESLFDRADCPLPLLMDPSKLKGENFAVPQRVPSQASLVRGRRGIVVSVSGGVDFAAESVLKNAETNPKLSSISKTAAGSTQDWWWD